MKLGIRITALGVALSLAALVAACAPATPNASGADGAAAPTARPSTPNDGLVSVTAAAVPAEPAGEPSQEATSPDPSFDYGFVIDITPGGFHPNVLVAGCCAAVTWVNLTSKAQAVKFTVELTTSPLIPPGGSWTWKPENAESVAYESITFPSLTGVLQVNQTTG